MRTLLIFLALLIPVAFAQGDVHQKCTICAVTERAGPEPVAAVLQHQGQTHYFCNEACKAKFESDPEGWAAKFELLRTAEGAVKLGPLPDFELEMPDGKMLHRSDWKDKVLIVDFWATWCGPCVQEIPEFVEFQKQNPNDLRVLGFSYDKEADQHRQFLTEKSLNYPSVLAASPSSKPFLRNLVKQIGPIKAIPVTLLVNRQGEIVFKQTGLIGEDFRQALARELQAK